MVCAHCLLLVPLPATTRHRLTLSLPPNPHPTSPLARQQEEAKPAAKKQKAADGSAVDVSAANGSRTIFMKNLAWAADEVRAAPLSRLCGAQLTG